MKMFVKACRLFVFLFACSALYLYRRFVINFGLEF